jgi:putative Mn2+ efflux pump MntP
MSLVEIFSLALALAMDAFSVGLAVGARLKKVSFRQFFRLAWHFGFFQAAMPIVGWAGGSVFVQWIKPLSGKIAFCLLLIIGVKMILEAFEAQEKSKIKDPTKGLSLIGLSLATSIDALAIGVTFSILSISIWLPVSIIGLVAILMTAAGMQLGQIAVQTLPLGRIAEIFGGLVLIGIGIKILLQDLSMG